METKPGHSHRAQTRTLAHSDTATSTGLRHGHSHRLRDSHQHRLRCRQGYNDRLTCSHRHTGSGIDNDTATDSITGSDMDMNKCLLSDWISGTLSQGCSTLQSVVKCPSHRDVEHSCRLRYRPGKEAPTLSCGFLAFLLQVMMLPCSVPIMNLVGPA